MWLLYMFLVIAGALNTIQSGANSALKKATDHPVLPGAVAALAGVIGIAIAFAVYSAATHKPLPSMAQWRSAPWWSWTGGILGATYVIAMVNAPQKVGAGVFTGVTVTASIVTALVLDHFGIVGFEQHRLSALRLVGAGLMIGGLVLIGKF